jgi:hypothetical protein
MNRQEFTAALLNARSVVLAEEETDISKNAVILRFRIRRTPDIETLDDFYIAQSLLSEQQLIDEILRLSRSVREYDMIL